MQIEFTWQQDESFKLPRDRYPRFCQTLKETIHPAYRRMIATFLTLMLVGVGLMVLGAAVVTLLRTLVGGPALLLFLFVAWICVSSAFKSRLTFDIHLSIYNGQTHTYQLTDQGIELDLSGSTLRVNWPGVNRLCVNDQWVVIIMHNHTFFVIPLRAFESDTELEPFLAEIERRAGTERIDERL